MKIGVIGAGYWGKIILKNLRDLNLDNNIVICEPKQIDWAEIGSKYEVVKNYKDLKCDKVFVLTPASSHFEICKFFLNKGIDVFCEKPLCLTPHECKELFELAKKNYCLLFVDWIFLYNNAVLKLKNLIKKQGPPKNIFANRLNFGPVRQDVNARWDLAAHDVSIACFLLDSFPREIRWVDFKRNRKSKQNDSCVGVLNFDETCVQINCSWEYGIKDRVWLIEFDKFTIKWDDNHKKITCINDNRNIDFLSESPLHCSIENFMFGSFDLEEITLASTTILGHEN